MKWNRYLPFGALLALSLLFACPDGVAQPVDATYRERTLRDTHRPVYHFTPPAFWLNDPNGLIQYKGVYHLFYQYSVRPEGPDAVKHWGHARSKDMLNWENLPVALSPVAAGPDSVGVWSGSALGLGDTVMLFYTSVWPENQSVAFNDDDELIVWRRYPGNPVIASPPAGLPVISFRDPTIWRDGDRWMMGVGSGLDRHRGAVLAYESGDLLNWNYCGPLYVDEKSEFSYVFECPTFMPIPGGPYLLLFSGHVKNGRTGSSYMLGDYAGGRFTPVSEGVIDISSDFYAAQGFRDENGRTLVFGWIKPVSSERRQQMAGWSGAISFPRELMVAADGTLIIKPAEELKTLRGRHIGFDALNIMPGSENNLGGKRSDGAEIIVRFAGNISGASRYGVIVGKSSVTGEQTKIYYDTASKKLVLDRRASSLSEDVERDVQSGDFELAPGEPLTLRIFVDRSVIEVFANNRATGTLQIYPTAPDATEVDVFSEGGAADVLSADIWEFEDK